MTRRFPEVSATITPAVWFPLVRTGAGVDVFTERLCRGLNEMGIRAEITWLPHRAEYLPWTVSVPAPPAWANLMHVNTWLHPRFIPVHLPVVATLHHAVHDPALRPYKGWLRTAYHRRWITSVERHTLRRADHNVAVSQFAADKARVALCDVPFQVIYNGIDTELFRPREQNLRSEEPFRLLYVGSWRRQKGVDLLAPIMLELGKGFVLHYTGGIAGQKTYEKLPENMIDVGRLQGDAAVAEIMRHADALLFPSRSEGFGLVAAEAMACGLPVIAFKGTCMEEVVSNGDAGMLVPVDDVAAVVSAARELACDAKKRRRMSFAARRLARERFTLASMLEAYVGTYLALLSHRKCI